VPGHAPVPGPEAHSVHARAANLSSTSPLGHPNSPHGLVDLEGVIVGGHGDRRDPPAPGVSATWAAMAERAWSRANGTWTVDLLCVGLKVNGGYSSATVGCGAVLLKYRCISEDSDSPAPTSSKTGRYASSSLAPRPVWRICLSLSNAKGLQDGF
jgi:hypothetical protein